MRSGMRTTIVAACFAMCGFAQAAMAQAAADNNAVVEASRKENGVLIYSNTPNSIWAPFLAALKAKYPWITVQTTDEADELWERYYAEAATGARTADLISTGAPDRWLAFVDRGELVDYRSTERAALPDWSTPIPGLYTVSTVPLIIAYNRRTVPTPPDSVAALARLVSTNPQYKGRVTTYDAASNSFGLAIIATWLAGKNNDWSLFDVIGPATRPERGSGTMREKLSTGEYSLGLFMSGAGIPQLEKPGIKELVGYTFPKDGTPVLLQSVGITKRASSPNSARLVLDFMMSREGQIAFAKGGFTPYREDIAQSDVPFPTLATVRKTVGDQNLLIMTFDRDAASKRDALVQRWRESFRGQR